MEAEIFVKLNPVACVIGLFLLFLALRIFVSYEW